jgi:hypothetical protein
MAGQLLKLYGGGLINPITLSPALWLDASDGATLFKERSSPTTLSSSDADPVGTWRDKSGNSRHFTSSTDARRPTIKLSTHNGKSSVLFDGTDDTMTLTATFLSSLAGYTIFMVRQWQTPSGTGASLTANLVIPDYVALPTTRRTYSGSSAYGEASTFTTNTEIVTVIYDGTQSTNATRLVRRLNGTQATLSFTGTIPATTGTHTSMILGGQFDGSVVFKGYMLEIIILTSTATLSTVQNVERYYGAKWGISVS